MDGAHLHLLVNHIPVLGAFGLLLLFTIAFARHDSSLARLTLVLSVALAAASAGVFLTGEPAEEAVEHLAGAAEVAIEPHEDAALIATVGFGIFGAAALVALLVYRRRTLPRWVAGGALVGTLVVAGLMGWAANLGGRIRHTEIGASAGAPPGESSDDDRDDEPPGGGDR